MASRTPSCWPRSPSPSSHLSPEDVVYLDHDDGCVTLGLAYASFFFVQSYPIFQYLYLKGHISRMGASNGIVFRILNEANSASPHELDPPHLMRLQLLDDPLVDLSSIRHSQGSRELTFIHFFYIVLELAIMLLFLASFIILISEFLLFTSILILPCPMGMPLSADPDFLANLPSSTSKSRFGHVQTRKLIVLREYYC